MFHGARQNTRRHGLLGIERRLGRFLAAVVVMGLSTAAAVAQSGKGELFGAVRDASNLAVPAASVTAEAIETGAVFAATTSAQGEFHILGLPSGSYLVTVRKPGFKTYERGGIQVRVSDRVSIEARLEVGEVFESVEVNAAAPLLETSSGQISFVVERRQVEALPLDGRNFVPLTALLPGVALPRGSDFPRINGSRPRTSEYIYDGVSVLQPEPGQVAFYPVIDAIEEFRVSTNSYSAEWGRANGGIIQVNHKAGTNELHGSVFEFFRHEKLNARNLFAVTGPRPLFRRNQYGGVVGGPLARNRTFFFADYQGSRLRTGQVRISTVPTSLQRAGDFREPISGVIRRIYDPATTSRDGGVIQREPFADNRIPASRFDTVAAAVFERYPLPNVFSAAGAEPTANNYRRTGAETQEQDQLGLRLDHYFSARHRLFARYTYLRDESDPVTPLPEGSGELRSGVIGTSRTRADAVVAEHSWTISPRALNQARFGFARRSLLREALRTGQPPEQSLGLPNLPLSSFADTLPVFRVDGYQQIGPTTNANSDFSTSVTQFIDTLSLLRAEHSVKVGADIRHERLEVLQPPNPTGLFRFTNPFSGLPGDSRSGNSLTSLLLGQVESFSIDIQEEELRPRATIAEFFVQDDWKVSPRLSVNLGLRYTLNFPSTEADDRGAVFDLETEQLRFLGQDSFSRAARKLHKADLGPRAGLAYRFGDSTVIRAGYGVSWFEMAGITTPFTTPFFPFLQTVGESSLDNIDPAFALSAGPSVVAAPLGPDAGLGQGVFGVDRENGSGYAQQWNLSLQRALGKNYSIEAAYVGSKLTRLGVPDTNINQLFADQLALGPALLDQVANPFHGEIPVWSSLGQPTLSRAQLLRLYPRFTAVSLYRNNIGHSVYHGVQTRVERRFSNGLTATLAYTFSKLIDDASSVFSATVLTGPVTNFPVADSHNRALERDLSAGDIPHAFSASFVYELP
ncbi:MAG: TonB-dependent receptor, partial [Bryobacterales bacterium]